MSKKKFNSVWDAIEDTPQQAASLKARAKLMRSLQEKLTASKLTQAQAAKLLGVTQPRVSDLVRGRIELFALETLLDMLSHMGMQVTLTIKKAA